MRSLRHFLRFAILAALVTCARAGEVRVVSQTVGSDELLLAIAEPSQIASLSHLAREEAFCGLAREAQAYPCLPLQGDAESILKHRPTLVLFADYSRADLRTQISRAGVDTLVFDHYASIEDCYANLRTLGKALGPAAEERAEALIRDCEARIARLRRTLEGAPLAKVIAPSTYGIIPGAETTFQDLCDHAGAENLAFTLGGLRGHAWQPSEKMLSWPIERLVIGGDSVEDALAALEEVSPYRYLAAARTKRVVLIEPYLLSCVSHLRVNGYEALARALHPDLFR